MPIFLAISPVRILRCLRFNLNVHAGGEIEFHQRVHRLRRRIEYIDQALVRTDFELLARLFIDMGRTVDLYKRAMRRGSGMGPRTCAPVRLAVETISAVDWSRIAWSKRLKLLSILYLLVLHNFFLL